VADAQDAPVLASVLAVVMVAPLAIFAAAAVSFGGQARRLGARVGLVPAILSGLAAIYFLVGFGWAARQLGNPSPARGDAGGGSDGPVGPGRPA
jgi:hypothetical protein